MMLGLGVSIDRHVAADRFDESYIELDHLNFSLGSHADFERALEALDARGAPHGEIQKLVAFQSSIPALCDPDNLQLKLTALYNL